MYSDVIITDLPIKSALIAMDKHLGVFLHSSCSFCQK